MFLADTNIYVAAANEAASRESLGAFLARRGPMAVSAVRLWRVMRFHFVPPFPG